MYNLFSGWPQLNAQTSNTTSSIQITEDGMFLVFFAQIVPVMFPLHKINSGILCRLKTQPIYSTCTIVSSVISVWMFFRVTVVIKK